MRILLNNHGDDYARRSRRGNPQKDVYNAESDDNPPGVRGRSNGSASGRAGRSYGR